MATLRAGARSAIGRISNVPPLLALELGLSQAQNVWAWLVLIVANVAHGYGIREDQFVAAMSALAAMEADVGFDPVDVRPARFD